MLGGNKNLARDDPRTKGRILLFSLGPANCELLLLPAGALEDHASVWTVTDELVTSTSATLNCREANRSQNRKLPLQCGLKTPSRIEGWPSTQPMKHGAIDDRAVRIANS